MSKYVFVSLALAFAFSGNAWPQQSWNAFDGSSSDTCRVGEPCETNESTSTIILPIDLHIPPVAFPVEPAKKEKPASPPVADQRGKTLCIVYFTGIGCPVCAKVDPTVLIDLPKSQSNLIVIEYEVYQQQENASLILKYDENYNCGIGIPAVILGKDQVAKGRKIIPYLDQAARKLKGNNCPLVDGSSVDILDLDIRSLPGKPKIWKGERILISHGGGGDRKILNDLLMSDDLSAVVKKSGLRPANSCSVPLSGTKVRFENSVEAGNWIFQWKRESKKVPCREAGKKMAAGQLEKETPRKNLRLSKILIIALADTVNPCALAVFILMLIGILSYNVTNRRTVLHAGFAFILAVLIMYFIYGLVIIRFWQLVQALTSVRLWLHTILGVIAICLGIFHLKDFFWYKPGSFATEMPVGWRGKVRKMMLGITSPTGAFFMGTFVTIFLIPCTMGPYLIAGGILSQIELVKTIPWLIAYNMVFITPLITIVYIIYFGFRKVEDVSQWKDRNIRYLHLIAGLIMVPIGIVILLGWI